MRRMPLNVEELEKIRYIEDSYDFAPEQLQNASKEPKYAKLIALMKEAPKQWCGSVLINDLTNQTLYTGIYTNTDIQLYAVTSNTIEYIDINYDNSTDDMEINDTTELLLTEDNIKTIFGKSISGTGDITMYRHQITIRFDTDTKEVNYVIYSSSKGQITAYDEFIAVAKPISNFNYPAVYVNGNNAEPAFIRFASNTILVGLSTGIEPYTGVSDDVSPI